MEPWDGPAAIVLHRRPRDRRDARPQRPAPRPLDGDEGRLGRARLGGRRARRGRPRTSCARAGCSRASSSWSTSRPGRIVEDDEVKRRVATRRPYGEWYQQGVVRLQDLPERQGRRPSEPLRTRQLAFGYTQEDLRVLLAPMAAKGEEPIGSMGNDISLAVLSDRAPPLFSYFKQLFAQVTNPPIDPIRESVVMSIKTGVGSEAQPPRRGARPRAPARHPAPDPAQPRARVAARRRLLRLPLAHDPDHVAGRRRAPRAWSGPCGGSPSRPPRRSPTARTSSCSPTAASGRRARRSRRCWPSPPSTTTSSARARACGPASCSSPASRARCTTSRR